MLGVLRRLAKPHGDPEALDCVVTTNLIQVGIDVPRLGLITFIGQPKSTSEYIQASSRVGRDEDAPGLIVTLFNHARARDRSHYETFESFHGALYRWVEPMSVTPFSAAALDRLLPAVYAALVRHGTSPQMEPDIAAAAFRATAPEAQQAIDLLQAWATLDPETDPDAVARIAERLARDWDAMASGNRALVYYGGGNERPSLLKPAFATRPGMWEMQTSMRAVERDIPIDVWDPAEAARGRR